MVRISHSLLEGINIARQALLANKTRSLLTTLGIIIGVVTVTLMMMIIQGLNNSFARQLSFMGTSTVYVERYPWIWDDDWWSYRNRPRLTLEDMRTVKKHSKLAKYVGAYVWTVRPIAFRDIIRDGVGIVGITPELGEAMNYFPEYGRGISETDMLSARKICMIGADINDKVFAPFNPIGRKLRVGPHYYKVVGILERKGSSFGESNDNNIIIPFSTMISNYGSRRDVTIAVMADDASQLEPLKDELTYIMRRVRHLAPLEKNDFSINEQSALTDLYKQITSGVYAAGIIIGGISLLVGGIGIMNIMLVSVTERTWEIGMRKAVGARTSHILWQFLIEAMIICLIGGIIGLTIAALLGQLIDKSLPTSLPAWLAVTSMLFSAVLGLFFGLFPAVRAARLEPITALRQE